MAFKNMDPAHDTGVIDPNGIESKLTFEDLKGYAELNFEDGALSVIACFQRVLASMADPT